MTRSLLAAAALMIATSAAQAGTMSINLPNLWFPETETVTVEKGVIVDNSTQVIVTEE